MEELALLIDEIQYNKYILHDLTPEEKTMMSELTCSTSGSVTQDTAMSSQDSKDSDKENAMSEFQSPMQQRTDVANRVDGQHRPQHLQTPPPGPPPPKREKERRQDQKLQNESVHSRDSSTWNASFSEFKESTSHSRIDLLLDPDPEPTPPKSPTSKPIPKVRPPPIVPSRSVRRSQVSAYSPKATNSPSNTSYSDNSRCLSPITPPSVTLSSYSPSVLRETQLDPDPPLTQIEKRLLEMAAKKDNPTAELIEWKLPKSRRFASDAHDEASLTSGYSNKRILAQFKGCVKCLID